MEENRELAMISQPMQGKTDEEIKNTRDKAAGYLCSLGYNVVDTFFADGNELEVPEAIENKSLWYLAESLKFMAACDAVYFCKGWENARGCRIEHEAAKAYGLKILYEEE